MNNLTYDILRNTGIFIDPREHGMSKRFHLKNDKRYFVRIGYGKPVWFKAVVVNSGVGAVKQVARLINFSEVLDEAKPEAKEDILYHMDLFR